MKKIILSALSITFFELSCALENTSPDFTEKIQTYADQIISEEIYDSSRAPTEKEDRNLQRLKLMIAQKHQISEIRFIDARSLINSMNLPVSEENYFINLIEHGSIRDIHKEVDSLTDNTLFDEESFIAAFLRHSENRPIFFKAATSSDFEIPKKYPKTTFKEQVSFYMHEGVARTKTYGDLIITLKAFLKTSESKFYDLYAEEGTFRGPFVFRKKTLKFTSRRESEFTFNQHILNINLNLFERESIMCLPANFNETYFFDGYFLPFYKVIFHEIGHIISANIPIASNGFWNYNDKSFEIASEGLRFIKNPEIIRQNAEKIKNLQNLPEEIFDILSRLGVFTPDTVFLTEIIDFFNNFQTNDSLINHMTIFQGSWELMQITGIFSNRYANKNILYIFLMSDLAASISEKSPVRITHLDAESCILSARAHKNEEEENPDFKVIPTVLRDIMRLNFIDNIHINADFYKALIQAYGISPKKYNLNNNLFSFRKNLLSKLT